MIVIQIRDITDIYIETNQIEMVLVLVLSLSLLLSSRGLQLYNTELHSPHPDPDALKIII